MRERAPSNADFRSPEDTLVSREMLTRVHDAVLEMRPEFAALKTTVEQHDTKIAELQLARTVSLHARAGRFDKVVHWVGVIVAGVAVAYFTSASGCIAQANHTQTPRAAESTESKP